MSLVVSKKIDNEVLVVSDLKLTNTLKLESEAKYTYGLKSVILNPWICISFAGAYRVALPIIDNILKSQKVNYFIPEAVDNLVDYIVNNISGFEGDVSFIVSARFDDARIIKIENGIASEEDIAWIGDEAAFREYQKYYVENINESELNEYFSLNIHKLREGNSDEVNTELGRNLKAMKKAIFSSPIDLGGSGQMVIGGFPVLAFSGPSGFMYDHYLYAASPHHINIPNNDWSTVDWGSVITGGFAVTTCCGGEGHGIIGFYIFTSEQGILFSPLGAMTPPFKNYNSQSEFNRYAQQFSREFIENQQMNATLFKYSK